MKDRKQEKISAIVLDVDDRKAKALTIRLNREHGELFPDKMSLILRDLSPKLDFKQLKEITFLDEDEILSFTEIDTEELKKQVAKRNTKNIFKKQVTCPNCNHTFELS
jgi:hypothetical protein